MNHFPFLIFVRYNLQNIYQKSISNLDTKINQTKKQKKMVGLPFEDFRIFDCQTWKNNIFQDVPIYFRIFFEVFLYNKMNKCGAPVPQK